MIPPTVPRNIEAEKSVITGLIRDVNTLVVTVADILTPADFDHTPNSVLFATLLDMHRQGRTVTVISLQEALRRSETLAKAGGATYILELASRAPEPADAVVEHAKIVARCAQHRETSFRLEQALKEVRGDDSKDPKTLLKAGQEIIDIASKGRNFVAVGPDDAAPIIRAQVEQSIARRGELLGISTGLRGLDRVMFGFEPTKLYILASRPGVGKTSFALNIAENAAIKHGLPVLFFSLEMASDELFLRLFCARAGVDSTHIKLGEADEHTLNAIEKASAGCSGRPLIVDDTPGRFIEELRLRAIQFAKSLPGGAQGLIIVDYLQLARAEVRKVESREREVALVSCGLKALAKEIHMPVLALSQLRRKSEEKKRPDMTDLRESGAIEQDADVVMFLHKVQDRTEEDGEKEGDDPMGVKHVEVITAKNRGGPLGIVDTDFEGRYTRFREREYQEGRNPINELFGD